MVRHYWYCDSNILYMAHGIIYMFKVPHVAPTAQPSPARSACGREPRQHATHRSAPLRRCYLSFALHPLSACLLQKRRHCPLCMSIFPFDTALYDHYDRTHYGCPAAPTLEAFEVACFWINKRGTRHLRQKTFDALTYRYCRNLSDKNRADCTAFGIALLRRVGVLLGQSDSA